MSTPRVCLGNQRTSPETQVAGRGTRSGWAAVRVTAKYHPEKGSSPPYRRRVVRADTTANPFTIKFEPEAALRQCFSTCMMLTRPTLFLQLTIFLSHFSLPCCFGAGSFQPIKGLHCDVSTNRIAIASHCGLLVCVVVRLIF